MIRLVVLSGLIAAAVASSATIDPTATSRTYDGLGGLSGGGATSRLLVSYEPEKRSQMLDLLFSPEGAALDILKVELGGDAQSTDGSESSHRHTKDEVPNFHRGYEWWLMKEAKQRNPNIKLYGLPWAFPKWVSGNSDPNSNDPYTDLPLLVNYTTSWVLGAKEVWDLEIDYIGSWNERQFNSDYLVMLRQRLDELGLQSTKIVAADRGWSIADAVLANKTLSDAVEIIGVHYPGSQSTPAAIQTGKALWASEDDSTFDDLRGSGCWAKISNRNFVEGSMTATIMWNAIGSYYQGLLWTGTSFFTANTPWSGHWDNTTNHIGGIYVAAHTTHFTELGWHYLDVGSGSGMLDDGGSFVSLVDDPTATNLNLTIVIEKISYSHGFCIRPNRPYYNTSAETATFKLGPEFDHVSTLRVYKSQFGWDGDTQTNATSWFVRQTDITIGSDRTISVDVPVDSLITITTLGPAPFMDLPESPADTPFPVPYADNFDNYNLSSEAFGFADQAGVWEIEDFDSTHGKVMSQKVPERPICWSGDHAPYSIIGSVKWSDIDVSVDVYIPKTAGGRVFLGSQTRVCCTPGGLYFVLDATSSRYVLATDFVTATGPDAGPSSPGYIGGGMADVAYDTWYTLRLVIKGDKATGYKDGEPVFEDATIPVSTGWPTIGTGNTGIAFHAGLFDNFKIASASPLSCPAPKAGVALSTIWCGAPNSANSEWDFDLDNSKVSLKADSSLCMSLNKAGPTVQPCNATDPDQQLSVGPINGKPSQALKSASGCVLQPSAAPGDTTPVKCSGSPSASITACDSSAAAQQLSYSSTTGMILSAAGQALSGYCTDKENGCDPAEFVDSDPTNKNLMWTHSTGGSFVNKGSGLCLDAWSGSGPSVGVYSCHDAQNQNWSVSGSSIKSHVNGNMCLQSAMQTPSSGNGFWLSPFGRGELTPYGPQNTAYCTSACGL